MLKNYVITNFISFSVIFIWISINFFELPIKDISQLEKYGFFVYERILEGNYHGIFSSSLVHIDIIHITFNLFFFINFSSKIEKENGSFFLLFLFILSSFTSSGLQLLVTKTTGIGLSGVLFSFIGFSWVLSKENYKNYENFITYQEFRSFIIWLIICFPLTWLNIMRIANYSHVGGLLCGISIAYIFFVKKHRIIYSILLLLLIISPIISINKKFISIFKNFILLYNIII